MKNKPFDFFDKIYCINLPESKDRWEKMSHVFKSIGIFEVVERVYAPKPAASLIPQNFKKSGQYGCTMSHIKSIGIALKEANGHVLILEDDISFNEDINIHIKSITEWLSSNDWDIFYLGGQPVEQLQKTTNKNIYHANTVRGTYGYIVNFNALKNLFIFMIDSMMKNESDVHGVCDFVLGNFSKNNKSYICHPLVVYPIACKSIIQNGHRDYSAIIEEKWKENGC